MRRSLPAAARFVAPVVAAWVVLAAATGFAASADFHWPLPLHVDEGWVIASSRLGALPLGDGWAGSDLVDRTLPPLHTWLARMVGGGMDGSRLASWLEGILAAALLAVGLTVTRGRRVACVAAVLLVCWPTSLSGTRWSVPWMEFATSARYDMAGVLAATLVAVAGELAWTKQRRVGWVALGVAAGLALLAHPVGLPMLVSTGGLCLLVARRRLPAFTAGLALGVVPIVAWVVTGWSGVDQLLAQLDRGRVLVDSAASELDRWAVLWREPDLGGVGMVGLLFAGLLLPSARPVALVALGTWLATSLLDGSSGGNYAAIVLPFVAIVGADLVDRIRDGGRLVRLAGAAVLMVAMGGVARIALGGIAHAERTPPSVAPLRSQLADGDRLFVQMKLWPLVPDHPAVVPFYVMQWARRPEDDRSLTRRLDDWCPTVVVRDRGAWPLGLVRPEWGGPELEAWLDDAVSEWVPVPIEGFDTAIEVGRVRPGRCAGDASRG